MNAIQIKELRTLIDLQYPHICLNMTDLSQFLNIPQEVKRFYKMWGRGQWFDKKGFFHNGKTTVWSPVGYSWMVSSPNMMPNHIRIADKEIPTMSGGANWSPDFSFAEEGSAKRIMKIMKLKAFW